MDWLTVARILPTVVKIAGALGNRKARKAAARRKAELHDMAQQHAGDMQDGVHDNTVDQSEIFERRDPGGWP